MPPFSQSIHPAVAAIANEMRAWRHHLHAHPETAFEEHATAAFVADRLRAFGIEPHIGLAGTGVVATLVGRQPGDRAIALRADMDALRITEQTDVPYRSTAPGRMHACGHDGHTAMLLGAAKVLAETRAFAGTVHLIFQPAEENEGGGRRMIEDGLFDRFPCDAVFGMHNWPDLPLGRMAMWPGPIMGGFDTFEVVLHGAGSHAAMPHLGHDPLTAMGHLLTTLQSIPGRSLHPLDGAVVSATQVLGGETWNIIPEAATLRGTARYFQPAVQGVIERRLKMLATKTAEAFGCVADVRYERRYPPTINTVEETERCAAAAAAVVGEAAVVRDALPSTASEDFAFMLNERPGCYVWLGTGAESGSAPLHNPRYDFHDAAAPVGASYWVRLVETVFAR